MTHLVSSNVLRICGFCNVQKAKMKKCSRCQQIYYCSKECQTLAWKTHRLSCKQRESSSFEQFIDPVIQLKINPEGFFRKLQSDIVKVNQRAAVAEEWMQRSRIQEGSFIRFVIDESFLPSNIPEKYQSYGLLKNQAEVETLVKNKELEPLILHIWAEKNIIHRINWIKEMIKLWPHPLFYLELSRGLALFLESSLRSERNGDVIGICAEALMAIQIGSALTACDCACFEKGTISDSTWYLNFAYAFFSKDGILKKFYEKNKQLIKTQKERLVAGERDFLKSNVDKLSHPSWVTGRPTIGYRGSEPRLLEDYKKIRFLIITEKFFKDLKSL